MGCLSQPASLPKMRIGPQTRQSLQLSDSAVTFLDSAVSVVPLLLVDDHGFADGHTAWDSGGNHWGRPIAAKAGCLRLV